MFQWSIHENQATVPLEPIGAVLKAAEALSADDGKAGAGAAGQYSLVAVMLLLLRGSVLLFIDAVPQLAVPAAQLSPLPAPSVLKLRSM